MAWTEEQLKAAAKKAYAAGDVKSAQELYDQAMKLKAPEPAVPQVAPLAAPSDTEALYSALEARGTPALPVQGEAMPPVDTSAIVPPGSSNDPIAKGINDVSGAFGAGLARGSASLVGMPGTALDIQTGSLAWLANKLLGTDLNAPRAGTSGEALQGLLGEVTGGATEFKGDSTAAQYAGTVGEFLPGTAAFGGLSPANLLRYGVVPGLASEAAGQATKDTALEPWARMVSALAAPLAVGALGKVVSPLGGADPERLKLAKVLDDFGVPVTAGQRTGSEAMRKVEAGTIGAGGVAEKQAEAFTAAALKTAGIDAKRATPEVLDDAFVRLGNTFDDIVRGVDITPDSAAVTKMSGALSTYRQLAPKASAPPIFENINKAMVQAFRTGNPIPAATLKVWRTNLSKLTTSADTATREVAQAAMSVVDDAISSGLVAAGKPEAVAKLAEARGQYRNLLALMTAASRAGETARAGILSPSAVARAVTLQGRKAFATGNRGDVGALAAAGEGVMAPLPTVMPGGVRAIEGLSSLGLGAAGLNTFGPYGLLAAAIPRATKELLGAPGVQNWLGNQAVNIPMGIPQVRATIPGLLAQ